jgi:rod shape determining protein RodA
VIIFLQTVGEEWGLLLIIVLLFVGLIMRIIYLAERQKTEFEESRLWLLRRVGILFTFCCGFGTFPTVVFLYRCFLMVVLDFGALQPFNFIFIKMDAVSK